MIRRLILFRPISEEEAAAATAWAARLGNPSLVVAYRPAPQPMRLLVFDDTYSPKKPRRSKVRLLPDALTDEHPAQVALRAAMRGTEVVFNVYSGLEENRTFAYASTDVCFTVAFPDGEAVAFVTRTIGTAGTGAIAGRCIWPAWRAGHTGEWEPEQAVIVCDAAARLFWIRATRDPRQDELIVMDYADRLLNAVPRGD